MKEQSKSQSGTWLQLRWYYPYYEKALAIAQEIGDRRGEGIWLGSLGLAHNNLGEVEKAIDYYEKALAIAQEIGDRRNEGIWLGSLGLAYNNLGEVEKAIDYYEKALAIAQEIGDRGGEGTWLNHLGLVFQDEKIQNLRRRVQGATVWKDKPVPAKGF